MSRSKEKVKPSKKTPKKKKTNLNKLSPKIAKRRMNYSKEQMQKAVNDVKQGMSCSGAAKKYGVPRVTLLYKVQGKFKDKKSGRESYLNDEEERLLVDWILKTGKAGFPVTKNELLDSVQRLVKELKIKNPEREFPFADNRPGRHWYESFLRRHPEISVRTPQNLTSSRANVTEHNLRAWHTEITMFLKDNELLEILDDPKRIYNADEAAFFLNPKGSKVLFSRGEKCVYTIVNNNEKECLTVMMSGNAHGDVCPSMVVYQYERVPQSIVEKLPPDWGVGRSENGWMTTAVFYEFLTNIFHPWLLRNNIKLPVILFVDGHSSHQSLHTSQFCDENGIILVALYPNATHIIQPMDVAIFRTLKSAWKEEVHIWRQKEENIGKELKKHHFGPLLDTAVKKSVTVSVLSNGFKKCGLFPWNIEAINFKQNPNYKTKTTPAKSVELVEMDKQTDQNELNITLSVIEAEIGIEVLNIFNTNKLNINWRKEIHIENHGLFQVWKNIKNQTLGISEPDSLNKTLDSEMLLPVISENDLSSISFDQMEMEILAEELLTEGSEVAATQSRSEITTSDGVLILDEEESQKFLNKLESVETNLPDTSNTTNTNCEPVKDDKQEDLIPSPFKRALVYPEDKTTLKKNKKSKEKIPFVVSSKEWQGYYMKKDAVKQEQERLKMERAKLRKEKAEKKAKVEEEKLEKRKQKTRATNNSANRSEESEVDEIDFPDQEDQPQKTKDERMNLNDIPVNSYVIVVYEQEFFPGVILEKLKNGAKVKVMTMAGVETWKWPEKEDVLFYPDEDVIEVIKHPELKNNRGHYYVPEIIKIRKSGM